jgi:hypothetical protein
MSAASTQQQNDKWLLERGLEELGYCCGLFSTPPPTHRRRGRRSPLLGRKLRGRQAVWLQPRRRRHPLLALEIGVPPKTSTIENFVRFENLALIVCGLVVSKIHSEHRDAADDPTLGEPLRAC